MDDEKKPTPPETANAEAAPVSDGVPHLYGAPIAAAPASESLFDLARGA